MTTVKFLGGSFMKTLLNAIKIMLLVVVSGIVLFLICTGGGRLVILFNFLLSPLIWIFTFPIIGPIVFAITGMVLYAVMVRRPSQTWKNNEKNLFILVLFIMVGGWLASVEYAEMMFLLTCLVGVSYPIIQIVRFEIRGWKIITDVGRALPFCSFSQLSAINFKSPAANKQNGIYGSNLIWESLSSTLSLKLWAMSMKHFNAVFACGSSLSYWSFIYLRNWSRCAIGNS